MFAGHTNIYGSSRPTIRLSWTTCHAPRHDAEPTSWLLLWWVTNATLADGDTRDTEYYEYHSSVQLEMQDLWISLLPIDPPCTLVAGPTCGSSQIRLPLIHIWNSFTQSSIHLCFSKTCKSYYTIEYFLCVLGAERLSLNSVSCSLFLVYNSEAEESSSDRKRKESWPRYLFHPFIN